MRGENSISGSRILLWPVVLGYLQCFVFYTSLRCSTLCSFCLIEIVGRSEDTDVLSFTQIDFSPTVIGSCVFSFNHNPAFCLEGAFENRGPVALV